MNLKSLAAGRTDLFHIALADLAIDDGFNVRDDLGDISGLCDQIIAAGGILKPLMVRLEGGRVLITDGHRRYVAASLARQRGFVLGPIPCMPEPRGFSPTDRTLCLLTCNDGKPLTVLEEAEVFRRLIEQGVRSDDIATHAGRSRTHVANCLLLLGAPDDVLDAIRAGKISASLVIEMQVEGGDVATRVKEAIAAAAADGKDRATRKHVQGEVGNRKGESETPADPQAPTSQLPTSEFQPPTSEPPSGIEAIKAAPSGAGGNGSTPTGEGGSLDSRLTKLNKLLETFPMDACAQPLWNLAEAIVDYLENRRTLKDVRAALCAQSD